MRRMKYVLNSENGKFLLIPDNGMAHSDVYGVNNWTNAGFINFDIDEYESGNKVIKPVCFGESVSLKLKSGKDDAEIIFRALREY